MPSLGAALLAVGLGLASCGGDGGGSTATGAQLREDRSFAACLERAGARLVPSRDEVGFLRGTSTEGEGNPAVTNGLVAAGRGVIELEWVPVDPSQRWRAYSRSYEKQTDSPDYEGIWQRIVEAAPDVAVVAVKRTGSPASFTAARRCVGGS